MIWRRGAFEIEVEWDHGPDVWIIFYGRRTHIFGISYQAYPTLRSASEPHFIGVLDEIWKRVYADSPTETPFREMVVTKASDIEPLQDRRRPLRSDEVLPGVTAEEYRRNEKWYDERYAVNVRPPGWRPSDDDPPGPGGHVA